MKTVLELHMKAIEPIILTDGSSEGMAHKTFSYIPGNTLLGAFATRWKKCNPNLVPDDTELFRCFFLSGDVSWGNAYPALVGKQTIPVPLCFQKMKNYDSLPSARDGAEKAALSRVMNFFAFEEKDTAESVYKKEFSDKEPITKTKKIASGSFMDPESFCRPEQAQQWNMHVGLMQRKAEEHLLFGYASLASGNEFVSQLICANESIAKSLADFLTGGGEIAVGRSRSAGYGRIRYSSILCDAPEREKAQGTASIYLLSDYIPSRHWDAPLHGFIADLERSLGREVTLSKKYCNYTTILGYNSHWSLSRRSREAILKGSVIQVNFDGTVEEFPTQLGGWKQEGYGRILCSPAFLKDKAIHPKALSLYADQKAPEACTLASPLVALVRQRALVLLAEKNAIAFCHDFSPLLIFLDKATKCENPSNAQLGNVRTLISSFPVNRWQELFREMPVRSKEAWEKARGESPFPDGARYVSAYTVMEQLLSTEGFRELTEENFPLYLPGSAATKEEKSKYFELFQRFAIQECISVWEKMRRRNG